MAGKLGMAMGMVLVAVALSVQAAGAQQGDMYDCSDFTYQEDAQNVFDANPNDPYGLDGAVGNAYSGQPNVACEYLPHRPGSSSNDATVTPAGVSDFRAAPSGAGAPSGVSAASASAATPSGAASTEMANTGSETLPLALGGAGVLFLGLFFLGEESRMRARRRLAAVWHNGWTTDR